MFTRVVSHFSPPIASLIHTKKNVLKKTPHFENEHTVKLNNHYLIHTMAAMFEEHNDM